MYENVYRREAMSSAEVIEQLKQRGMSIPRLAEAEAVLERLNYYRLSAYWHQYLVLEEVDASFRPGTSFDDVIDHYDYDQRLRELVWLRLEVIEVALRRSFACLLAQRYGPFPHLHPQLFANRDSWTKSHIGIQSDYRRANEEFVKHHSKTYPDLILPPIGAVVECVSFGALVSLLRNLAARRDRNLVSREFGLDETVLLGFLQQLVQVRNICAHHGRLWNRQFSFAAKIPHQIALSHVDLFNRAPGAQRRMFNILVIIDFLEMRIKGRSSLLSDFSRIVSRMPHDVLSHMGAPHGALARIEASQTSPLLSTD